MGMLTMRSDKYVWSGSYDERHIPKEAGFRWDRDMRYWFTKSPDVARKLRMYADASCAEHLEQLEKEKEEARKLSRAADAAVDVNIPIPPGLELLPYQRVGVAYALNRKATLFGDEMGLGKTIQAIAVANATNARRIIIVCPLSVKLNWEREISKWSTADPPLSIGHATAKEWPSTDVVIAHWAIVSRHEKELLNTTWDLAVIDEAHFGKNRKAERTRAVFGDGKCGGINAKCKLALTGTPIPNKVRELYPILSWLKAPLASDWKQFHNRYCGPRQEWQGMSRGFRTVYDGASNLAELQDELRSQVMVRRCKADVLTELPPKRRQLIILDPADIAGAKAAIKAEVESEQEYEKAKAELQAAVELAAAEANSTAYEAAVQALRKVETEHVAELARLRHATALVKAPAVIEHITAMLDDGVGKVVLWAHHHDVIDTLAAGLTDYNPVVVTGETPQAERQEAVDRFQNDDSVRVFIGSITAAGTGITLTAASNAVFAELDWVPGNMSQAEDRCHRIGQKDAVLIQHIVLDGSIDAKMAQTLLQKQAVADQALDAAPTQPIAEPVAITDDDRPPLATPDGLAALAAKLTPDDIDMAHQAVKTIAGLDPDQAAARNGVGFSKVDTLIGHKLAEATTLTPKQAALALKLVVRYRRQLPSNVVARALTLLGEEKKAA
jgi:SWI/SNF-related matrix-associated actin-dependent regulator 1 of chromatin subfamily A